MTDPDPTTPAPRAGGLLTGPGRGDLGEPITVDLVLNTTDERVRELARMAQETAHSARAMLAIFRGLPAGTDSARAKLVLSGVLTCGTDEAGFSTYEAFTCEGGLQAAVSHLEYAERILGERARALDGKPRRLAVNATDDPERCGLVASTAEGEELEVGWIELIRHEDGTKHWRARLTEAGGGPGRGSMGDYESTYGLLEALERHVAEGSPWWAEPRTGETCFPRGAQRRFAERSW